MRPHEEIETLSAYLDQEVDETERARIEAHLASCPDCSEKKLALEGAVTALAGLPEVRPDREESRSIRLRVLQEVAPRLRAPQTWGRRLYAAVGALALVAAGIVGVSVLSPGGGDAQRTALPLPRGDQPGRTLGFTSPDQVLRVVAARPDVIRGARRYRVADVSRSQSEALESAAGGPASSGESKSRMQAEADSPSPRALFEAAPSGEPVQAPSVDECLRKTLRSQRYPLMPLLARPATFKGEPVWLLVYSWTPSKRANAPLDRVQVWLVSQQDCQERYYSSFTP